MPDITLGVVAGPSFYFSGAAQWDLFDEPGKLKDSSKLVPATVLRTALTVDRCPVTVVEVGHPALARLRLDNEQRSTVNDRGIQNRRQTVVTPR
jgi:hypothetical protein